MAVLPFEEPCRICGIAAAPLLLQECFRCGARFHLNPYANAAGVDCGDAVLGAEAGVEYYCHPCIAAINDEIEAARQRAHRAPAERAPGWRA